MILIITSAVVLKGDLRANLGRRSKFKAWVSRESERVSERAIAIPEHNYDYKFRKQPITTITMVISSAAVLKGGLGASVGQQSKLNRLISRGRK
jgi:hypothetical protein